MIEKMREYLEAHKGKVVDITIIMLVGLIAIVWFRGDFILSRSDFVFPPDSVKNFFRTLYVWDLSDGLGCPNSRITAGPIFGSIIAILEIVGFSLAHIEQFLFYVNYTLAGLSMYYLTTTLIKGGKGRVAGLVSAFSYMINGYLLIWMLAIPFHKFFYAFFPLILALFIRGINERKGLKYAFFVNLVWLITSTAYANPMNAIMHLFIVFSYFLFDIILNLRNKDKILHTTRFSISLILIWIALNMFWILPETHFINNEYYVGASLSPIGQNDLFVYRLNSVNLIDILRLQGFWAFNLNYKGDPYYPFAPIYSTNLFILLSFLIPILAFLPVLLKPKDKYVLYFSLLALFSLFMIKGPYPPFGEVNEWIFNNIPFSRGIREPFKVFGPLLALSYAFLIGVALSTIYSHLMKKNDINISKLLFRRIFTSTPLVIIVILLFGVYMFPFWTGDIIYPGGKIMTSERVKIPSYYYEAASWLNEQLDDFTVYSLPMSRLGYVTYSWDQGYYGSDITLNLFSKPIITSGLAGNGTSGKIADMILNNQAFNFGKVLALMNVKYVIFHNDTNWEYIEGNQWTDYSMPRQDFISFLNSQESLYLEKQFSELYFYRNECWKPNHIYATSNPIYGSFMDIISMDLTKMDGSGPDSDSLITYEKINPTKYVVHVKTPKSFFLVFSETYDGDWVAHIDGEEVLNHFTVNGFANAWYINKTGSFDVILEFLPQRVYYYAATISISTFILGLVIILSSSNKRFKKIFEAKFLRSKQKANDSWKGV